MRNILRLSFFLASIFVLFTSCERSTDQLSHEQNNMLHFETMESYINELILVKNMNHEELLNWEQIQNFSSFGVQSSKEYQKISESYDGNIEKLTVDLSNNKYLKLVELDHGEFEIEYFFSDNPNQFFANDERLFAIGDEVAKIFENTTVLTSVNNIDFLRTITENEIEGLRDNDNLTFWNNKSISGINLKSSSCNFVNDSKEATATDDNNRVKITLAVWETQVATGQLIGYVIGEVKPQVRRLGIWWSCSRTINGSFKIAYQNREGSGWSQTYQASWSQSWINASSRSGYVLSPHSISQANAINIVGFNCEGRSYAVPNLPALLQCNPELCQ